MKKLKRLLTALLAVVLLVGVVPAYASGLNPETCTGAQFDESVYDEVTTFGTVLNMATNGYKWPSSGTVLVKGSGANLSMSSLNGVVIPSGLVVDFYKYYKFAGNSDYTYELMAHYNTTNGSATIGSRNTGPSSNSGTVNRPSQAPSNSGNSGNSSTSSKDWGEVQKVFVPGTPSSSYNNYYTDVTSGAWYYHPVMTLTEGDLLAGYGNNKFGPNDTLTKEQLNIIITRMAGGDPYYNGNKESASRAYAVIWLADYICKGNIKTLTAYETEIARTSGVSGGLLVNISSNGVIGGMWQCVYDNWRASLNAGRSTDYIASLDEIPDADNIRNWIEENWEEMASLLNINNPANYASTHDRVVATCEQAICRAYNLGMVSGYDSAGTFGPYDTLTRAQLAQMMYNMGWTTSGCLDYF